MTYQLLLFASLHELGHLAALYILGGRADAITLSYYGIGLRHHTLLTPVQEGIFLLAGAAVNLLFTLLHICVDINAALLFINILPLYPLDGGRVLQLLVGNHLLLFRLMTASMILLIFMLFLVTGNITLLLIDIYTVVFSLKEDFKC